MGWIYTNVSFIDGAAVFGFVNAVILSFFISTCLQYPLFCRCFGERLYKINEKSRLGVKESLRDAIKLHISTGMYDTLIKFTDFSHQNSNFLGFSKRPPVFSANSYLFIYFVALFTWQRAFSTLTW